MDNGTYDATIATRVETALKEAGQSVRATAIATGIPYTTLDRKLKGAPFQVNELRRIGRLLGLPTSAFIPEDDELLQTSTSKTAVAS